MRRIRAKHTAPEVKVRRLVHSLGFRYRLHVARLPGKPDLVLPRLRKIIEVHGCFWHQHKGCVDSHIPKSRVDYWWPKLLRNQQRDKKNLRALRHFGYSVLIVWECQTKNESQLKAKINKFLKQ